MNPIRVGIVGAGDVVGRHVEGLVRSPGVRITAVAEPIESRRVALARAHGIEFAVADYRLLLAAKDVDVVLLLTPHNLHAAMTVEALQAGKHVVCEKPMAPSLVDCDRMLDTAQAMKRELYITHSLREDFFYKLTVERTRSGALGKLLGASFRWYTNETARLNDPTHWKGTKAGSGGGVLVDGGCHVSDLANAFFGRARRVTALASKLVAQRPEVAEDTAAFSIEYESGALVSVLLSFTAGSSLCPPGGFAAGVQTTVHGSVGSMEGGFCLRGADFRRFCTEYRSGEPDQQHHYDGKAAAGDIDFAIFRALAQQGPPPLTALDARNAVAVVEAAYESIDTGHTADVDWRDA